MKRKTSQNLKKFRKISKNFQHCLLDNNVYEKVEGWVESDEGVRDPVNDVEPVGPVDVKSHVVVLADECCVKSRNQFPHVAKDKQPNDA